MKQWEPSYILVPRITRRRMVRPFAAWPMISQELGLNGYLLLNGGTIPPHHTSLQMSSFQALNGYKPPHFSDTVDLHPASQSVEEFLREREQAVGIIRQNLLKAQSRTK